MNKAFTRESDHEANEPPASAHLRSPLPPGAPNYMTPDGAERLRSELAALTERSRSRTSPTDPAARSAAAEADARARALTESLHSAVIVPPPSDPDGPIRFGARVVLSRDGRTPESVRIVGVDETDEGAVSWISPLGRALTDANVGDVITLRLPSGAQEIEILSVAY